MRWQGKAWEIETNQKLLSYEKMWGWKECVPWQHKGERMRYGWVKLEGGKLRMKIREKIPFYRLLGSSGAQTMFATAFSRDRPLEGLGGRQRAYRAVCGANIDR